MTRVGTKKPKKGCEITEVSKPRSVNDTGYNDEAAKYMANPEKGFNDALRRALDKKGIT